MWLLRDARRKRTDASLSSLLAETKSSKSYGFDEYGTNNISEVLFIAHRIGVLRARRGVLRGICPKYSERESQSRFDTAGGCGTRGNWSSRGSLMYFLICPDESLQSSSNILMNFIT